MPDRYSVAPREVLGKRVKRLRWDGVLPANIYGRGLDSVAVQLGRREAEDLLSRHGMNALITLSVDGEGQDRPAVVRSVQRHPLSREIQHLDFYQVDLTRPLQAMISVQLTGDAPAVHTYQGVLIQGATQVSVLALPAALPSHFELSIESLTELEMQLTIADLDVPDGVEILGDPEIMLVRVQTPRKVEEADEEELLEGEEAIEGAEAEASAEGDSGGDDDSSAEE